MADVRTPAIEIDAGLIDRLHALAAKTERTPKELLDEALAEYLDYKEEDLAETEDAIKEVDAGAPMIDNERVMAWIASWGTENELPRPR
jgi:predicted transcriptional regulator